MLIHNNSPSWSESDIALQQAGTAAATPTTKKDDAVPQRRFTNLLSLDKRKDIEEWLDGLDEDTRSEHSSQDE